MAERKDTRLSGRDYYSDLYRTELDYEAQWLRCGAVLKANSVEILLKSSGFRPRSILELGCGTGAVILECQRRQLASEYFAIDYSPEAISYLKAVGSGIACQVADITDPGFRTERSYDLILLSHVIEHLEDPGGLLHRLTKRIRTEKFIIEVPLEDLLASRLKNHFRDRLKNKAGHLQFFTAGSFRRLLCSVGLTIERERQYAPSLSDEAMDLISAKDSLSPIERFTKRATQQYLPRVLGPAWQRWYYSHLAALCRVNLAGEGSCERGE
jgi:SAM-dependent methyltransferase